MVNTPGKNAVSLGLSILIAKLMLHDKWDGARRLRNDPSQPRALDAGCRSGMPVRDCLFGDRKTLLNI
jgi:hypothetical protein